MVTERRMGLRNGLANSIADYRSYLLEQLHKSCFFVTSILIIMAAIVRASGISLHFDSACHLWNTIIDVGLGFLRIHCTYDVLYCFQWWTLLHFHAVIMVWAIRIGGCKSAMFLSNHILIVYVSSRLLGDFLKVGFLGRVVIDLVLCAGTPCLWVRRSSFWTRELLVLWNLVLVCYKLFVQQDLSPCGVLLLFVASVVEARCRWYHTKGVMQYYRQMS